MSQDSEHPTPRRRVTLADVMIVIAATALGMSGVRKGFELMRADHFSLTLWGNCFVLISPVLMSWSPSLIALRLRRPRPRWRDVSRQPGFVACCVTSLIAVIEAAQKIYLNPRLFASRGVDVFGINYYFAAFYGTGRAVAVAWFVLALTGCWLPEPGWIDRAGRALGAVWIAGSVLSFLNI